MDLSNLCYFYQFHCIFLQGLESYINNLPSKDELESLRAKLTQKTERNERLEAKIEALEGAHTGNAKLNHALQTQCKNLEEEVRLNQLYDDTGRFTNHGIL